MHTRVKDGKGWKPIIVVSMGDYNGVGPELALKAVRHPGVRKACRPVLVGSIEVYEYYARRARLRTTLREIQNPSEASDSRDIEVCSIFGFNRPAVHPGVESPDAGRYAGEAIRRCVVYCITREAEALVTAPTSKSVMNRAGFRYPGQTEMVAEYSGGDTPTMILIAGSFRVALATVHLPLARVASSLSTKLLTGKLRALNASLKLDFGIPRPRIAVLGLNPHAGEQGLLGNEEKSFISPAVASVKRRRILAEGPFPADGFFARHAHRNYDAILAMYHDQGLIPLKMSGVDIGVNFSSGLPVVRTSPDHGTAFGLAGKGKANPGSMIEAIKLAVAITRNRRK